jgi:glycosyltransferase involved in cell wall biosynthesis
MRVISVLEHRFKRTPDGKVWTQTTFPYSFWLRYLEVFDRVAVVARVSQVDSVPADWNQANGENVEFIDVPNYLGPGEYLKKFRQVKQAVRGAVQPDDAIILRLPSNLANDMRKMLDRTKHPYAAEVVADPYDAFAPGSIDHPLRPIFQWKFPRDLRNYCADAFAAAYVTKFALQERYPCPQYSQGISDVVLPDRCIVANPRPLKPDVGTKVLVFIGTMSQLYKAPDVLIKAVAVCVRQGIDLKLVMLGDGQFRPMLTELAATEQIGERVQFMGQMAAGEAVEAQLDAADVFVLPSYQEGLPRAMVEAMARALPCIGSKVGGVPELLAPEDMVVAGDVDDLARKIADIVTNPKRMAQMSVRNLDKAREYRDEVLAQKRTDFYRYVRTHTEKWLAQK